MPAATPHRLLLVVDGTAALREHYSTLRKTVVEPMVDKFHEKHFSAQSHVHSTAGVSSTVQYCIVVYRSYGCFSDSSVEVSEWTHDHHMLYHWLDCVCFDGGGYGGHALVEGLHHAWLQFVPRKTHDNHMLVITASEGAGLTCRSWVGHGEKTEVDFLKMLHSLRVKCSLVSPRTLRCLVRSFSEAGIPTVNERVGEGVAMLSGLELPRATSAAAPQAAGTAAASTASTVAAAAARAQQMVVWKGQIVWQSSAAKQAVKVEVAVLSSGKTHNITNVNFQWPEQLLLTRFVPAEQVKDIGNIVKTYMRFNVTATPQEFSALFKLLTAYQGKARMGVVPVSAAKNLCLFPFQHYVHAILLESNKLPTTSGPQTAMAPTQSAAYQSYSQFASIPPSLSNSYNSARQFVQQNLNRPS